MEGVTIVKVKKKNFALIITMISMVLMLFVGCTQNKEVNGEAEESGKINIVTTLFPQYDFTRQIVGDKANVTILLPSGKESHTYEPTSEDIIKIGKADMFIYTGKYMETWADKILKSVTSDKLKVVDVSTGINLDKEEEEHDHEHEDEHKHDEKEADHAHTYDPHIWTSPENAKAMVDNILKEVSSLDPENKDYYTKNATDYKAELDKLSSEFKTAVSEGKRKKIIFGGRFALHYLVKEYGIEYESAYDSCSTESEPSAGTLSHIIKEMKDEKIPVIYYEELVDPKVSRAISTETGAEMLLLHSSHNLSKEEFEKGETYLSLMKQNLVNLKKGLN